MNKPLVSICCLVYNHEPYLRECFDGFIMQKTSFPFEVLIHDDASTENIMKLLNNIQRNISKIVVPNPQAPLIT